ncbi:Eco57I restriction-modification methylase domain-containing protein [Candidatus Nanohalococcus occultus]|uniref:Eco57I restriction-modification methylase domain-containing protein n=1 Tax=Candidatus Nanohalococcus occultus TaxID=2978047 RepID=UPI0039E13257
MAQKPETPYNNNLFSNHFLEERLQNLEEWKQAEIEEEFDKIQELWDKKKRYLQNHPNEDNTQDEWINDILKIIGHNQWGNEPTKTIGNGRNLNPDYLFFKDFETKLDSEDSENEFEEGYLIGEAKKWDRTLDKSMDNHENPSFQIFNYVDRLRTPWGLLTNGKKWRLYSYEDCEADTFYEIDIVEAILKEDDREQALQNFKYFYLFFRKESFIPSQKAFVDQVFEGSENYAKGLEEDLEDDIYTALEVTARGFFETNDIEKTEENIEEVHRASLILLYRMLFILNAESRGLLPMDEKKYRLKLSLEYLKGQLEDENDDVFSQDTWAWDRRIRPLFEAINEGEQYGEFKITAYNGGLFDEDKHPFLAQHELQGNHLREILELLAQSTDEETGDKVLVDYRDLNIRHLGSVYEGLLEHELKQAEEDLVLENGEWESASDSKKDLEELPREKKVREGEVYLTNESGERKATGSYYTPEYIVEYIVENTVGPKVEDKIEESDEEELLDNVLDLNICDPAMGSGHFLTEATSFIARRVLEHGKIQDEEVEGENEFVWVKRQVVSHCIYGVDINPLAVELGKLSLWIETMAEGRPLSFLDHHLKVGNSLVGTSIDELEHHPGIEERPEADFEEIFGVQNARDALNMEYKKIEDMSEETKEEVHEKEEAYREFKEENFYYKFLKKLSNVHTHLSFEEELSPKEYNQIRNEVMDIDDHQDEEWYQSAQNHSEKLNYFHWELEFPKVFFGEKEGFDAVVGNPPYVKVQILDDDLKDYLRNSYNTAKGKFDLYIPFTERSYKITGVGDNFSYILPSKFTETEAGQMLREMFLDESKIEKYLDFSDYQVFPDVTTYTCVIVAQKQEPTDDDEILYKKINKQSDVESKDFNPIRYENLDKDTWNLSKYGSPIFDISKKAKSREDVVRLDSVFEHISKGIDPGGSTDIFVINEEEAEELEDKYVKPLIAGDTIKKYNIDSKQYIIFPYSRESGDYQVVPEEEFEGTKTYEYLKEHESDLKDRDYVLEAGKKWYELWNERKPDNQEVEKLVICNMSKENRFAFDKEKRHTIHTTYSLIPNSEYEDRLLYFNGLLNSDLITGIFSIQSTTVRGGYYRYNRMYLKDLPLIENSEHEEQISNRVSEIHELKTNYRSLNLDIHDYLGNYSEGDTLDELCTPASGVSDTPLTDTASDREKLQVGSVDTQRNGDSVTVLASARYKPEDESGHDTDQYGYTETEMFSAMEFHDLSETEKALIEEFVPVAVDEAGGFADFRKKATKTMSLIDRLKKLTLPKVSDVEDDLQKFIEQRNKAEELEEKIQETDQEINEIVYDLYDLTEEEIEIVEESVDV